MLLAIYYMALRLSMFEVHPFSIVFHISVVLGVLVFVLFSLYYKWLDKAGKYVFYYILVSFIIPITILVIGDTEANGWWWTGTIAYLLQFLTLSGFYFQVIKKVLFKRFIASLLPVTFVIFCLDFFWWEGPMANNDIFGAVRLSLLIIYGIVFSLQLMSDKELITQGISVQSLPSFWFNAGVLIFCCSSFLLSSSSNHFSRSFYFWFTIILVHLGGCIQFILFYIGPRKVRQQARRKLQDNQINIDGRKNNRR